MPWRPDQDCKHRTLDHAASSVLFLDDGDGWPLYANYKLVKFLGENARERAYSCARWLLYLFISLAVSHFSLLACIIARLGLDNVDLDQLPQ